MKENSLTTHSSASFLSSLTFSMFCRSRRSPSSCRCSPASATSALICAIVFVNFTYVALCFVFLHISTIRNSIVLSPFTSSTTSPTVLSLLWFAPSWNPRLFVTVVKSMNLCRCRFVLLLHPHHRCLLHPCLRSAVAGTLPLLFFCILYFLYAFCSFLSICFLI